MPALRIRPRRPRGRMPLVGLLAAVGLLLAPVAAQAGPFSWSAPVPVDHAGVQELDALTCLGPTRCVALDGGGNAVTFDPQSPATGRHKQFLGAGQSLRDLACPSASRCVATGSDATGAIVQVFDPGATGPVHVTTLVADRSTLLTAIACPSTTQCTAVDADGYATTFDPADPAAGTRVSIDHGRVIDDIACPTTTQCTVVDGSSYEDSYELTFDPNAPGAPTQHKLSTHSMATVSCPSTTQCTATDTGNGIVTFDPQAPGAPTPTVVGTQPWQVTCPTVGGCVGMDSYGRVMTFDPNAIGAPTAHDVASGFFASGLACPTTGQCTVIGNRDDGHNPGSSSGYAATFDPAAVGTPSLVALSSGVGLFSLACPSTHQCTGTDVDGVITFDPQAPGTPTATPLAGGDGYGALHCPSTTQCFGINATGGAVRFNPQAPATAVARSIASGHMLVGTSCPSTTQCTAVDADGGAVTYDPQSFATQPRVVLDSGAGQRFTAVDCPTVGQCTGVDYVGNQITFDPRTGTALPLKPIDAGKALLGLDCPTAHQCTAIDEAGQAVTFDPLPQGIPGPAAPPFTIGTGYQPTSIACPSATHCVVLDRGGRVIEGDPQSAAAWTVTSVRGAAQLYVIACPTENACVAADSNGAMTIGANGPLDVPGDTAGTAAPAAPDTALPGLPAAPATPGPAASPASPGSRDRITALRLTPSSFFASRSGATAKAAIAARDSKAKQKQRKRKAYGTVVSYRNSEAATVTFVVLRRTKGRRHGRSCGKATKKTRKAKSCTSYAKAGSFSRKDGAGATRFRFMGRLAGRTLKPGSYRLTLTPRNGAGTGAVVTKGFKVKRG